MKTILDVNMYSVADVAKLLGVSTSTVRKYEKEGRLSFTLIGGKKLTTEDELKSFINPAK